MSHLYLRDPSFREFLFVADRELADQARAAGCPACGGALHAANYWRFPRGGPFGREIRFSFCCAVDGCRRRQTPPSWRFLGRKVYLGAVVVLISVLRQGESRRPLETMIDLVGVCERTLVRWRRWWRRDFARSRFWLALGGLFAAPVDPAHLPASLFDRFDGDLRARLVATLRMLLPITGGRGLAVQPA